MFKIRFYLGAGPNFGRWQIKKGREVLFYDPKEYSILAFLCKLRNSPKIAQRIMAGENKTVCAWIECEYAILITNAPDEIKPPHEKICFNPRKRPHWFNSAGENLDNKNYPTILTKGKEVYITY